jgi:hypothetical protein
VAPDLTAKSDRELGEYRSYLAGPVLRSARNSIIRKRKIMASIAAVDREFAARAAARRNGAPRTLYN